MERAHDHPARNILVAGGIRGSKSVGLATEAIAWSPHGELLWLGADTYDLARLEFEYTAEGLLSIGWTLPRLVNIPTNKFQPCSLETVWGTRIETRTLHDVSTFVAQAPDWIGICEPGLAAGSSLQRARERASTRRARIHMAGTFEEVKDQWMENIWRKWVRWPNEDGGKSFTVPSWMNTVIFPKGKYDPEIAALRRGCKDYNEFLRRVVGVPSKMPDVVFQNDFQNKIHAGHVDLHRRDAQGNPIPVYVAVDPGYSDGHYAVLAIQIVDGVIRVFDCVDHTQETHAVVIHTSTFREWWPYVRTGVIDPHMANLLGNELPQVAWREAGVILQSPQRLHVEELVKIIQSFLRDPTSGKPRLVIDAEKCQPLIKELNTWRRRKVPDGLGPPTKRNCDFIKALGYFLTWYVSMHAALENDRMVVSEAAYG
jgi:hypothetical protein